MFNSEMGGLVKKEQYKDYVRERSEQRSNRRRGGVSVLLLLGLCAGLFLAAWSCNIVLGIVPGLKLPV